MKGSYRNKVLDVDLTSGTAKAEQLPESLIETFLGGRGLNIRRFFEEVPRDIDPLGPENALYIGIGPLEGTSFPGSCRVNFTARSPQTGLLGDSNAGGFFGPELKYAGFDQVVLRGRASKPVYLFIHDGACEFRDASNLWGKDIPDTQKAIIEELGDSRVQVAAVGPAAERGVKFAGIFCNLVRAAARTGMGTVLASKNVKAIAVRGTMPVEVALPDMFDDLVAEIKREILVHPQYKGRVYLGTTALMSSLNQLGCLCTRHYRTGRFEAIHRVSGERLADTLKVKGKACFSCIIPCSRYVRIDEEGKTILASEGPEFEGLAAFTSKVGNPDLKEGLIAVDMCNRLGMDVITTSEAIAFLMELYERGEISSSDVDGLDLSFGNMQAVYALIEKIARREGIGDLLGDGAVEAARKLGVGEDLVMHVKGLEIFKADPRGLKGYALGLAVASRGGDHLRSEPSFEFSEDAETAKKLYGTGDAAFRLKHKGKGRVVKDYEERCAIADCLNACKNTLVNMEILPYDRMSTLLHAATGIKLDPEEIRLIGERIVNLERMYLVLHGVTRANDTLPKRFTEEPLPEGSGPSAGSVVELEPMLDEYYESRGWDIDSGIPEESTLKRLGILDLVNGVLDEGLILRR